MIRCFGALTGKVTVTEQDAGLHFLARLHTHMSDDELRQKAAEQGLHLAFLSDYYHDPSMAPRHVLVVNYSGMDLNKLPTALERLAAIWEA